MVRNDPDIRPGFRVHMRTTSSHAKFVFLDTEHGWRAAVGSCNWLWSPFRSVEISVVLSDTAILADFAAAVQQLLGRCGLADEIANEMGLTARDLRRSPSQGGSASMAVILGEAHDQMNRMASGSARKQFFIGCHKLGSTARPGAIMQGEAAAGRGGVNVTTLYTQPAGPLKKPPRARPSGGGGAPRRSPRQNAENAPSRQDRRLGRRRRCRHEPQLGFGLD
jgi:cardiolipin synthase A/B